MGYEITRFVDEVDVEFHCPICLMVMDCPFEVPCEHSFCCECITERMEETSLTCPVDHSSFLLEDLRPSCRIFRNLLDKHKIKCDFQPNGCATIVRLEHLENHVKSCVYSPEAEVVCDKGCNIKMRRRKYLANDCDRHLADEADRLQCLTLPSKWQVSHKMIINHNEMFSADGLDFSFVQYVSPISPRNSSIKIQKFGGIVDIGFGPQGHPIDMMAGRNDTSIGYDVVCGELWLNGIRFDSMIECEDGDIVEFGIIFPTDFDNDSNNNVKLFFSRNDILEITMDIKMPNYAIFPIITLWGLHAKIEHLEN